MKLYFKNMRDDLISGRIAIEDILKHKKEFNEYVFKVIGGKISPHDPDLKAFIQICNDVYSYSVDGEVMIADSYYDQVMNVYKSGGNDTIVFADTIGNKQWDFIEHEMPGVVGTLQKVYKYKELKDYLTEHNNETMFTLTPKYDGISCAIRVKHGQIVYAATRYNGIKGQNITRLIQLASNVSDYIDQPFKNGYFKCELCVSTKDFEELSKLKKYSNRRSATAGIVNTPSNLQYAGFITIVPLIFYDDKKQIMYYLSPIKKTVTYYSPADLMDEIEMLLEHIRSKDFPFRVDGVVINPGKDYQEYPNELDLMDNSTAFKVNTAEGKTRIKYGYMSVGRLGKAVPMLKVDPVEVNETIVEDVSLGSYDKFLSMDLKENEEVIVYSAGDVIPQIKLPSVRANLYNSPDLKISKKCPYCGEKLARVNTEYYCANENCPRIITGKIANFVIKLGIEDVSDKTVEIVCNATGIRTIHDFLHLNYDKIIKIDRFRGTSAMNLAMAIQELRRKPITVSQFFGSLGIDKISEKKARKIFEYISIDEVLNSKEKKLDKIFWRLQSSDGIGPKTAKAFIDYIKENRDMINELIKDVSVTGDIKYKASVVFTGCRPDKETEERLHEMGYEISDSVTKTTILVIAASMKKESTKIRSAMKKGIPIYPAADLERVMKILEKYE